MHRNPSTTGSAIAIAIISVMLVSAVALAARVAGQPSDNPWDYTMFAFRDRNAYRSTAEPTEIFAPSALLYFRAAVQKYPAMWLQGAILRKMRPHFKQDMRYKMLHR